MFMPFSALAAGLAISPDGSTLFVANYQNDSLSVVNTSTRLVTNEFHFFVPGQATAVGEMPYWPVVVSNAQGAPVKTYVSSQRDGQVLDVGPSGLSKVIRVGGEPNRMVLSADQTRLYVANGDLDEIEVIDTTQGCCRQPNFRGSAGLQIQRIQPQLAGARAGWAASLCDAGRRERGGCH
jgi:DNA-binding beta-propeller fold protein YncE